MREFIYFSSKARTSGNFTDLMKAGRMDIVIHFLINSMFISNNIRDDVILHLIFYGQPDPPKHLEINSNKEVEISKKDVAGLIKRMLYKYKEGRKIEVFPGCFVEKKSLFEVIDELKKQRKEIYILDKNGKNAEEIIKNIDKENAVFLVGDHEGLPKKEVKRLKQLCKTISLGKTVYFASQTATILNYILDKK